MTISRFYRILLALCGLVGVSIQIHDDGWGMLLYYTVLSNILVFSSLIFFIIYDFKKGNATTNTKLLRYKGGVIHGHPHHWSHLSYPLGTYYRA